MDPQRGTRAVDAIVVQEASETARAVVDSSRASKPSSAHAAPVPSRPRSAPRPAPVAWDIAWHLDDGAPAALQPEPPMNVALGTHVLALLGAQIAAGKA